jgi:hypothetical protein
VWGVASTRRYPLRRIEQRHEPVLRAGARTAKKTI